ncbi:MAG: tripartite tricarboxylate transporter substrate-binding protein, partial [Bacillota bacterium]
MVKRIAGVIFLGLVIMLVVGTSTCVGADYPTRSIDLIVGFGQGGGTDVFTRALAPALKKELGVNVAVINMPGASSATAMNEVLKRPADGYTVFMITSDMLTNDLLGRSKYSYKDLIPIVRAHVDIGLLQVSAKSPFQSWDEFATKAKAEPNKYTIAGVGAGSFDEQALGILMSSAGIK